MATRWAVGLISVLGVLGASVWLALLAGFVIHRRSLVRLKDCPDDPPGGGWPTLTVIFAARNEAEGVERATRSMLAQDDPGIDFIAVDDRSTDATGAILDALGRDDPRLRVVHVLDLPPGWLGKCHALHEAAGATSARWLLFTDADVRFAPGSIRRGVAWAEANGLDHLTLAPEVVTESFGERAFLAFFCLAFAIAAPPWRVADPRRKTAIGIGAFNLVRAEAFRAVSGFTRLAMSVDDDMRLGQALKFSGYRGAVVTGQDQISVRWQVGLGGMVRGLEKNIFAAADFRLELVPLAILFIVTVGAMPHAGVFVGPWWARAVCGSGVAAEAVILGLARGQNGVHWYHAISLPVGSLAYAWAMIRSVVITLRQGGVRWRDRLYPLDELKAHVRRRNAWAVEAWRSTR